MWRLEEFLAVSESGTVAAAHNVNDSRDDLLRLALGKEIVELKKLFRSPDHCRSNSRFLARRGCRRGYVAHIEPFIEDWLNRRKQGYSESQRSVAARELREPPILRRGTPE